MPETKPYRPANGTDGMLFMAHFCEGCKRDQVFQETGEGGCPIAAASLMYDVDEEGYPKEWIKNVGDVDGATARCTAFEAA